MTEAGAEARFLDGGAYCVHDHNRALLVAPTQNSWEILRHTLSDL